MKARRLQQPPPPPPPPSTAVVAIENVERLRDDRPQIPTTSRQGRHMPPPSSAPPSGQWMTPAGGGNVSATSGVLANYTPFTVAAYPQQLRMAAGGYGVGTLPQPLGGHYPYPPLPFASSSMTPLTLQRISPHPSPQVQQHKGLQQQSSSQSHAPPVPPPPPADPPKRSPPSAMKQGVKESIASNTEDAALLQLPNNKNNRKNGSEGYGSMSPPPSSNGYSSMLSPLLGSPATGKTRGTAPPHVTIHDEPDKRAKTPPPILTMDSKNRTGDRKEMQPLLQQQQQSTGSSARGISSRPPSGANAGSSAAAAGNKHRRSKSDIPLPPPRQQQLSPSMAETSSHHSHQRKRFTPDTAPQVTPTSHQRRKGQKRHTEPSPPRQRHARSQSASYYEPIRIGDDVDHNSSAGSIGLPRRLSSSSLVSLTPPRNPKGHHRRGSSLTNSVLSAAMSQATDASMLTIVSDIRKSSMFSSFNEKSGLPQMNFPSGHVRLIVHDGGIEDDDKYVDMIDSDTKFKEEDPEMGKLYQIVIPDHVYEGYHQKLSESMQYDLYDVEFLDSAASLAPPQQHHHHAPSSSPPKDVWMMEAASGTPCQCTCPQCIRCSDKQGLSLPETQFVMAVPSDLYRRVLDEASASASMPCGLFFCGQHDDVSRPSLAIAVGILGFLFSCMAYVAYTMQG